MVSSVNHPGEERMPELAVASVMMATLPNGPGPPGREGEREAGRLTIAGADLAGEESPGSGTLVQDRDPHP